MSARNEDFLFAQEAQNKGYVTEAQVEEAFLLQKRMTEELKIDERLAVILVKRGWIAEEQARRVYALIEPEGQRTQIQGYRLVERIGSGAMGTVYKAIHLGLHRVVAIKVLRPELLADQVHTERLKGEAHMLASLDHPNIVRALDAGESNGFPYVVMEYVEGETLKERISREGTLPEEEALRITRCIADALERARRMGVVHRDVKPSNILISKKGEPKLMDLGLARGPIDHELTQHGATVGTPQFMSPEQIEDAGKVDTRSDIYSLGGTLYAMLTGKPPHTGATMTEILTRVLNEQPVAVRHHNKDVSPEVGYLVERMMLKDATLRYQTPAMVVEDIDNISGGQSIVPTGFTGNWEAWLLRQRMRRFRRWTLRAVIVLIAIGVGGYLIVTSRARSDAVRVVTSIEDDVILTVPDRLDTIEQARRKLESARQSILRIRDEQRAAGIDDGVAIRVQERERLLHDYVAAYEAFFTLREQADVLVRSRQYATAFARVGEHAIRAEYEAIVLYQNVYSAEIRDASDADWTNIRDQVRARAIADLDALVTMIRAYDRALRDGDFVLTGTGSPIAQERLHAEAMTRHLDDIERRVAAFRDTFADAPVQAALDRNSLARLNADLTRDAKDLRTVLGTPWRGMGWSPALVQKPLIRHGEDEIDAVADRVDSLVREHFRDLERQAAELEAQNRIRSAIALLQGFVNGAGTSYDALVKDAERHVRGLREKLGDLETEAEQSERRAVRNVLAALRRGDVRAAQKEAQQARKGALDSSRERRADQLRHAVTAYEAALRGALAYLAGNLSELRPARVRLRDDEDGAERFLDKFRIASVDVAGQTLSARGQSASRGMDRNERTYAITDFHVWQLSAWLREAGTPLPDRDHALLVLLATPNEPFDRVRDLRVVRAVLRDQIAPDLEDEADVGVFEDYVVRILKDVGSIQGLRVYWATSQYTRAVDAFTEGFFAAAARAFADFLDPDAVWHYTDQFDLRAGDAAIKKAKSDQEAAREEIGRWLLGVQAWESAYETRLSINFDLEDHVLDLFEHGFARLVKQKDGRAVTPDPTPDRRFQLELLPGVEGVLPNRPLTFTTDFGSPFDPAHPITVEFDLNTGHGAFFLALDIDGVQVGVLSADPAWYPTWRVPEALRDDDDDDLVGFHGRGRGIGTHEGIGFGNVAGESWSWDRLRQGGRRHASWRGPGQGRDVELSGDRFAFVPGRSYRVRLRRERDTLVLWVADLKQWDSLDPADREKSFGEPVYRQQKSSWGTRGKVSATEGFKHGSGKIQILSWSTVVIDDLDMTGVIRRAWREAMREKEERAK